LTEGRIGWNVVTSFTTASAEAVGFDEIIPHDERYERADEYMDILYE
jgi:long-chain alkane monooxygenase